MRRPSLRSRVAGLVALCRRGQRLVLTVTAAGPEFGLEPSGTVVSPEVAESAVRRRMLRPAGDGLFGTSQTWGLR